MQGSVQSISIERNYRQVARLRAGRTILRSDYSPPVEAASARKLIDAMRRRQAGALRKRMYSIEMWLPAPALDSAPALG
jgi:hypothetical protein